MASKTTNYNLDMPGYDEIADIDVINGNMDKIDVQMKNNADSAQQSKDIVSDEYSATNTYAVGDYCIHENILYKCKTAITTGEAFDSSKWVQTTCGTEFGELNSNLAYNASKNMLLVNVVTISGVTITSKDKSTALLNGTSTSNISVFATADVIPSGSYHLKLSNKVGSLFVWDSTHSKTIIEIDNTEFNFTLTEPIKLLVGFSVGSGYSFTNFEVSGQLEKGTVATDFVPYNGKSNLELTNDVVSLKNDLTPILIQKQISESDWSADGNVYRTYVTLTDDIPSNKKVLSLYQARMYKGDEQSWLGGIIVNNKDLGTKLVVFSTTKINCTLGLQVVLI